MDVKVQSNSTNKIVEVDEKILNMSKEEALSYMGLAPNADKTAIDNKFWHFSKQCDKDESEDADRKFSELSVIYDIATGNRDRIVQENTEREGKRKFFGKTASEWKTYISYTWYKYLLIIAAVALVVGLLCNAIFGKDIEGGIVVLGQLYNNNEFLNQYLSDDIGYEKFYLECIDYAVPNDLGIEVDSTTAQAAHLAFYSDTNVIITDSITNPYFFDYYDDVSDVYAMLQSELTPEQLSKIEPVYFSQLDYQKMIYGLYEEDGFVADDFDMSTYSDEKIMIGIRILDDSVFEKLGIYILWPDEDTNLVFGINTLMEKKRDDSVRIITELFKKVL